MSPTLANATLLNSAANEDEQSKGTVVQVRLCIATVLSVRSKKLQTLLENVAGGVIELPLGHQPVRS